MSALKALTEEQTRILMALLSNRGISYSAHNGWLTRIDANLATITILIDAACKVSR